ncbi:MAG TPA: sigma-70 family RNA polymerase sigma factor [Woeseiaceae bacterium]|nr:sigma-70 family RNA polymerase sigma factor [Woeseiaceae bacterium]
MTGKSEDSRRRHRFERLVGELRRDMYRYAFWLSRDGALAEDVVQEAMVRAWRNLDSLREDGAAKQWLLTIVRRENARQFERKRLETVDVDDLGGRDEGMLASSQDTDVDDLREQLLALPDEYREPLVLQVMMGYTTGEIAEVMELKQATVLTRLHRARNQLKERFAADGPDLDE